MILLGCIALGVLYLVSLIWVFRDARRHGPHPWMAVMFVMVAFWPLSLSAWIMIRSKIALAPKGWGSAWG